MLLAILLGAVAGFIGFLPLLGSLLLTKRTTHGGTAASMIVLLLGLFVSFVVLFLLAILFIAWDRPNGFVFLFAEVIVLCAVAIGFGLWRMLRK